MLGRQGLKMRVFCRVVDYRVHGIARPFEDHWIRLCANSRSWTSGRWSRALRSPSGRKADLAWLSCVASQRGQPDSIRKGAPSR